MWREVGCDVLTPRKEGGKRNENKCSLLRGVWIMNRRLCAGAEQCPELSHGRGQRND